MCRFRIPTVLLCLSLGLAAAMAQSPTAGKDHFEAAAFGTKADGKSDDTAAIQKALDAAGKRGGVVRLPAGHYLVAGSLKVPVGVSLVGSHQAPVSREPLVGTVVLATGGRDNEDAPALFELGDSSAVLGLTVFYPDQKPDHVRPYAWTFHLQGSDNTVENVTLINAYNGIKIGPEYNQRHRIRSVVGCVLRRGIWVDNCYDIGRIENVHWSSDWWSSKQVGGWDNTPVGGGRLDEYLWKHLVGFTFG
ncbi:MAG: glycoside hydrolase family 55 protein, partial [Planctomycetales bacterium]|nr:glycoside hydrolase family 55 protein [Planctomycetales bacterium]